MGFAPAAVVEGPPRLPLPYGLFSVVSLAEAASERWENGVTWEALTCDPSAIVIGDCDVPKGFPKTFVDGGDIGSASAFTVYGTYKCGPIGWSDPFVHAQARAREHLLTNEQKAVESKLWSVLDDAPTVLTGGGPVAALGSLEKWLGEEYGALGVIHVSRLAATTLGEKGLLIDTRGGQMFTRLGTPVVVGAGYPGTGTGLDEVQTIQTTPGATPSGTFTVTVFGQTTAPIAWDATAADVEAAFNALSAVNPGDMEVTAGPLGTNPVTVTFGGQYNDTDIPLMSANDVDLVDCAVGTAAQVNGGATAPDSGEEFIVASPALMGYRSEVFANTGRPGDLLDRGTNDLYGIAERNYLVGFDPCGVAFAPMTLGV